MSRQFITIKEIGKVWYYHNPRAKRLILKIDKSGKPVVVIPYGCSADDVVNFINANIEWIKNNLSKLDLKSKVIESGYQTKEHKILLKPSELDYIQPSKNKNIITVYYPQEKNIEDDFIQESLRTVITKVYKYEASLYIPKRIKEISTKIGLNYRSVKINSAKTRWGSCSSIDNINFTCFIMKLPNKLIDYIIIHELCHTVYKDHSANFWKLVDQFTNTQSKNLRNELKQYSTSI